MSQLNGIVFIYIKANAILMIQRIWKQVNFYGTKHFQSTISLFQVTFCFTILIL